MTTVVLDSAGRVLLPKLLRKVLGLEPGDTLEVNTQGEQVTLRPVRSGTGLRKKQGIWVFRGGRKINSQTTDAVLQEQREARDLENLGPKE